MNLYELLILSLPAMLVVIKLSVLLLAVAWALGGVFGPRGLLSTAHREPLRRRAPQA